MNNLFLFNYPNEEKFKIDLNNNNIDDNDNNIDKNNKIINKFLKKLKKPIKPKIQNKDLEFAKDQTLRILYQPYLTRLFFNYKDSGVLLTKDINKSIDKSYIFKKIPTFFKYDNSIHNTGINEKFNELYYTMNSKKIYNLLKDKNYCERIDILFESQLKVIYQIYNYLNIGGILIFSFMDICFDYQIECIYLLSLLFENIIINYTYSSLQITCINFVGEKNISKDLFKQIIKNSKTFSINPKPQLSNILEFINNRFNYVFKINNLLNKNNLEKYKLELYKNTLLTIHELSPDSYYLNIIIQNFIEFFQLKKNNLFLSDLFSKFDTSKVTKLYSLIKLTKKYNKVLQIGFSYGSLSYNLLNKNKNINLTILDPYQEEKFDNNGIEYLNHKNIKSNRYIVHQSDIIENLTNFNLNKNKFSIIILSIDEPFEKLSSYLIYLNNILENNGLLFINSFNTEYLKLIDYLVNKLNSLFTIKSIINHNYYVFSKS